jgi:dipeptidase D
LECGVIVSKKPALEAISFGPLIRGAHSPDEHVVLSTVEPIWKLLTTVLADLS